MLDALGDDLDEHLEHLDAWSEAIIAAGSNPKRIAGAYDIGGGPHFGSGLTVDTAAELYGRPTAKDRGRRSGFWAAPAPRVQRTGREAGGPTQG